MAQSNYNSPASGQLAADTLSVQQSRPGFPRLLVALTIVYVAGTLIFTYVDQHSGVGVLSLLSIALFFLQLLFMLVCLILCIVYLMKKLYLNAAWLSLSIAIFIFTVILGHKLTKVTFIAIDNLRYHINAKSYNDIVKNKLSEAPNAGPIFIDWGSNGFLSTNFFYALVYDSEEQVTRLEGVRGGLWNNLARSRYPLLFEKNCKSSSYRIEGNFFSLTTICQ